MPTALPIRSGLLYTALAPVLSVIMLLRLAQTAWQRRSRFGKFVRALPLIAILLASWSLGEAIGYFTRTLPKLS